MAQLLDQCPVLKQMLEGKVTATASGEPVPLDSNIPLHYAQALYNVVRQERPRVIVEVGLAYGASALTMLTALRDNGDGGRLISIDPMQTRHWKGCGVAAIARAGLADQHQLVEDYDYHALPRLLADGVTCQFAYIDGWHTFDYTLVDFWYIDKMMPAGGVVAFNDCGWPAVDKVIKFVLTHRRYTELNVGLPMEIAGYSRQRELLRRLCLGRKEDWYRHDEDRYFRKAEAWEPRWDFFAEF